MRAKIPKSSLVPAAISGVLIVSLIWRYPLFHVRRLDASDAMNLPAPATFDANSAAANIWKNQIPIAISNAVDLVKVAAAIATDPEGAKRQFGKAVGLGSTYYLVRGSGKVIARDRNYLTVAADNRPGTAVALRIGPIFGNTIRDGCGQLDLNKYSNLADFNALSASLNALAEQNVIAPLRGAGLPGVHLEFCGCAVAPDDAPSAGEPSLTLVPLEARIQ